MDNVFLLDQKKGALDYWRIVDRIIQEIALQQEDGSDPDMAPVDVHVKHIINKLVMQIFCLGQYDILEYGIFQHLKYLSPFRIWPKYMNTYHNNVALVPVNLV